MPVPSSQPTFLRRARAFASGLCLSGIGLAACGDPVGVSDSVENLSTLDAIATLLEQRSYATWAAEPEVHDGNGPHGLVRVYFNPSLATTIAAGQPHELGAISVKEIFRSDRTTLRQLAVGVKDRAVLSRDSWVWYEADAGALRDPEFYARASPTCADCHDSAAIDQIFSTP